MSIITFTIDIHQSISMHCTLSTSLINSESLGLVAGNTMLPLGYFENSDFVDLV